MLPDNEELYRRISSNPNMWRDRESCKISTAAFKDSQGCSVDRKWNRTTETVKKQFCERFTDIEAVACVTVKNCVDVDAIVKEAPEPENKYHCEIHRNEEIAQLTKGQLKRLVESAVVEIIK